MSGKSSVLCRGERVDTADLALTVGFRRRPNRAVMEKFTDMVTKWHASVAEKGIFGEGPVIKISPTVDFQSLRAQFRVDCANGAPIR